MTEQEGQLPDQRDCDAPLSPSFSRNILLEPAITGIVFTNSLPESETTNYLRFNFKKDELKQTKIVISSISLFFYVIVPLPVIDLLVLHCIDVSVFVWIIF